MTFENDEARKEYFTKELRKKLKEPEFRAIEGFPIGTDEDIIALSDPPYYTACPNPFIEDFIKHYGKPYDPNEEYNKKPFAADVSEGKNDPIYNAHSYHTKVPHKAIMRYILHYTEPGDIVFDGFCGTGMTGVAAQLCGDQATIESLGYRVEKDGVIYKKETDEDGKPIWQPFSKLGIRRAVLNDLSPAATFIAYNYNTSVDAEEFKREAKRILQEVEEECGWMYETLHTDGKTKGRINYTVWSDVFVCPECSREIVFWDAAVDKKAGKVLREFSCPHCDANLTKRSMERAWITKLDKAINQTVRQAKQIPVLINYSIGKGRGQRFEKVPDTSDLALIQRIEDSDIPYWFPTDRMPEGDESRRNDGIGLTHVHHFYTRGNLYVVSTILKKLYTVLYSTLQLQFLLTSFLVKTGSLLHNIGLKDGRINLAGAVPNTLFIPSTIAERNIVLLARRKLSDIKYILSLITNYDAFIFSAQSASSLITDFNTADYIFTDPPFGGNLMYSELNFLWESWLKVFTNNKPEAIENKTQGKGLAEYQKLMERCFKEYYRVLKPGRWMTMVFHNSKNSVWNAIQEALQHAGFVVADVRTLDKQQGSFNQVTARGAVKQNLVVSAYKPNDGLEKSFKLEAGTKNGVWAFVRTHLKQLHDFITKENKVEIIGGRQGHILYDCMVAFHVRRGVTVPLSAAEFYQGLHQRFPERDGMYFLPDQVAEYDKKRMKVRDVQQLELFILNEESAIRWLKYRLDPKPQTFQELHPQFMKEITGWQRHEKPLELLELLEQNFLRYDGTGEVPSQIHSYLSTNFKDMRNLSKEDPALQDKAKDRWYVPDPNKAGDLGKLRERTLLKEFEEYRASTERRFRVFRTEAVRAGFKKAWAKRDYHTIINVAKKIPDRVLQEDPKLLMWRDNALTRIEDAV
ncbi:MAG: site-specific DNA-methyltransferase [Firmicutes bacterium]|nr:site-specific DNA-methyltransferase [Bacillota bacterium]